MPKTATKRKVIDRDNLPPGFFFDEENHVYFLDGKALFGVTSVLSVIAKPMLIQWSANMACEYVRDNSTFLEDSNYYKVSPDTLLEAKTAHRKKKEDAGSKGTDLHGTIEQIIKNAIENYEGRIPSVVHEENEQVSHFLNWAWSNNVKFLESEKRVYSEAGWYAGTLDMVFEMDGKKWIGDVKTGRSIYPEYYLQMAAYQMALEEMKEHEGIYGAMVINLKKTGGIEVGRNYDYQGNKLAFLAALTLHKHLNN